MSKSFLAAGFLLACFAPEGDRPPEPWPGPKGDFLFLEAEDFALPPAGWVVDNSPIHGRTETHSNLKFLAGHGAGRGAATRSVRIPADGAYRLWIHHSQKPVKDAAKRGPFKVTITQNGKETFTRDYADADPKGEAAKAGFPSFRWESAPATFTRGDAVVTLQKTGPDTSLVNTRLIDCLLLTQDLDYEPNYRDFAPQTYVRIRLLASDPNALTFHAFFNHMRKPWYENVDLGRKTAGTSTAWINLSRHLYSGSDTNLVLDARNVRSSNYVVEFATAPTEAAIVSSHERKGAGSGIMIRMPPDLTEGKRPKSDLDYAAENLDLAKKTVAPLTFGKLPERYPVIADLRADDEKSSPGLRKTELQAARALGINGVRGTLKDGDVEAGIRFGRPGMGIHVSAAGYSDPNRDRMVKAIDKFASELAKDPQRERYQVAGLSDEASPDSLEEMKGNPAYEKAFVEFMKGQPGVALTADRNAPLYFASQQFRAWSIVKFYLDATQMAKAKLPSRVLTSQNFSDGAVYTANLYGQGNDYFTWFRSGALDAAWSEDWSNGSSTPQLCGWNVALLRAATRERGQPIGMYVIAGHKRNPLDVKLKAYSDLAQGARFLEIYPYSAPYGSHESSWYLQAATYAAVAQLTREIGAAEHVLVDAKPRKAETAILYSRASDIWNAQHDSLDGHERMHTYLALRHAQVAVDVMDEDDVAGGGLAGRRVAYLFGEQLDRRCVAPLAQWVREGGTLVLSPGAGGRNEQNAVDPAFDQALDLTRSALAREKMHWGRSRDLRGLKSLGGVDLEPGGRVDWVAVKQPQVARDGDAVTARFDDKKPAVVSHAVGKGRVVSVGFLAAVGYIRGALGEGPEPRTGREALPAIDGEDLDAAGKKTWAPLASTFSSALRELIVRPARAYAGAQPVDVDAPLVEATFLESAAGWVIPLANYTGTALAKVTVTVRAGDRAFGELRSSHLGVLPVEKAGANAVRVTLPLDSTDIIYAEWAPK